MSSKRVPKLKKRKEQVADKAPQPPSKRVAGIFAPSILEVYGEDNLSMVPPLLVAGLTTTVGKQEADDADNVGHCRCLKSRCLKLYCDCFVSGLLCSKGCKCEKNCQNNDATEENRAARIEAILYNVKTNPITFRRLKRYNSASNVVVGAPSRKKGPGQQCSCIKTQCLKKFCLCFRDGRPCGNHCTCQDCMNQAGHLASYNKTPHEIDPAPDLKKTQSGFETEENSQEPDAVVPVPLTFRRGTIKVPGITFEVTSNKTITAKLKQDGSATTREAKGSGEGFTKSPIPNYSRDVLVKRTFDEIQKTFFFCDYDHRIDSSPSHNNTDEFGSTRTLALHLIKKMKSHMKYLAKAAKKAEAKVREKESKSLVESAGRNHPAAAPALDALKVIPIGTKFTKQFDVLGEFEGEVVSNPSIINPFYEIEYEDGGSESLLHPALVKLLRASRRVTTVNSVQFSATAQKADHDAKLQKIDELARQAADKALSSACEDILKGRRKKDRTPSEKTTSLA